MAPCSPPKGRRKRWVGSALCLCLNFCIALPLAASDAEPALVKRLQQMAQAMRSFDYDATLVYLHDNHIETMRVIHLVSEGGEREQLISLSGSGRGVRRDPQKVTCTQSDGASIGFSKPRVDFARNLNPEALARAYRIRALGEARVAGRRAEVIGIQPKDAYRYGYRFAIDQETALLLKNDVMGESPYPIEQLMITSLELKPKGLIEQAPSRDARPEPRDTAEVVTEPLSGNDTSPWSLEGLPLGFELQMRDRWPDGGGRSVVHLLVTDGLAATSVYIEPQGEEGLVGGARMGAINAWGGIIAEHQVTVVGQVPVATVQRVFAAVRPGGPKH